MTDKNISFHILMQYPPFKEAVEENNREAFEAILYEAGIDVSKGYEVVSCEHRPYEDKPFTFNGPLCMGTERRDAAWMQSELCSWENKRASVKDPELRAELSTMGKTGCADRVWSDENLAKKVLKEQNKV